MLKSLLTIGTTALVAAAPAMAANSEAYGERRSGATAGAYFSIPFGGTRGEKPHAGLRLQVSHDYRNATAQNAPVVRANALDLRLVGEKRRTLYIANVPVTGEEARKHNLAGVSTAATVAILAATAVGAIVLVNALSGDTGSKCLDPAKCEP